MFGRDGAGEFNADQAWQNPCPRVFSWSMMIMGSEHGGFDHFNGFCRAIIFMSKHHATEEKISYSTQKD
jgi:hypothetical protein